MTPVAPATASSIQAASARWAETALRFDAQPALYADPSWLPGWAVNSPRPLPLRIERELSNWLLAVQQVGAPSDWGACCGAARLFMIDAPARDAVALAVGVAAQRGVLRQVVLQARIKSLQQALGDALDTLWSPLAESVPHETQTLSLSWREFDAAALRQTLQHAGLRQLLRLLNPADPAQHPMAARAALCAPRLWPQPAQPVLDAAQTERLSALIVQTAVPQWASAWTWLF